MANSLISVNFHDDTIFYTEKDGEMFVPMRPIIENMGLDWASQYTKLKNNEVRWGVVMITTPLTGGNQETICIPFRKLAGFLATINPDKVREDLRGKIRLYQNECDNVLHEYWTTGKVEANEFPLVWSMLCWLMQDIKLEPASSGSLRKRPLVCSRLRTCISQRTLVLR